MAKPVGLTGGKESNGRGLPTESELGPIFADRLSGWGLITQSDPVIRRLVVIGVGLDPEPIDEVKISVQCRCDVRLMTRCNEWLTLHEALGRVRERFGAVPGDLVVTWTAGSKGSRRARKC
jgi:hypothetical protein